MTKDISNIVVDADKKLPTVIQSKNVKGETSLMSLYNMSINEAQVVIHQTQASNMYQDAYSPSMSIRDEFDRLDYQQYRPGESIPTDDKGMIAACMQAYQKSGNGIIKNIVDLMSDFAVQGIDVAHPDKKTENVLRFWFHKIVKGRERSERFTNLACRVSNMIVKRDTAKLPLSVVRKMYRSTNAPNAEYDVSETEVIEAREFPVNYTFLHPLSVDVVAPELGMFLGNKKRQFSLKIPESVVNKINYPKTDDEVALVQKIPADIVNSVRKGNTKILLDPNKVAVYYYKKDDWQVWATPMIYTVLSDVKALEKMKLADLSALDGVISQIRIWKIGDIAKGIKPSAQAMSKLAQILMSAVSGGIMDLMWQEDLQFQNVPTDVHHFLGDSKYIPILNAIYTGLGIPPLFSGASTQGSFTNNFLAIKTMIERLESLRNLLRDFWGAELELVGKALKLDVPASITFDRMTLNDESSVLTLLLQLVDRGYLSIESVQEMVGANPEIEDFRIKREWKEQQNGKRPPKASPFHKPEWENTYLEDFIKLGEVTPSQIGIELESKAPGEVIPATRPTTTTTPNGKPKGIASDYGGRKKNAKDTVKRKQKEVKPRRSVNSLITLTSWASDAQNKLSEIVNPIYLDMVQKNNLRQLTNDESSELERLKFASLASLSPLELLTKDSVVELLSSAELNIPEYMDDLLKNMIFEYTKNNEMTVNKRRELQSIVYAACNVEDDEYEDEE